MENSAIDNSATENVQLTSAEAYELHQSRKRIDATILPRTAASEDANLTSVRQVISYRDLLLGENYGSLTKATETVTTALDGNYKEVNEPMHGQVRYRFLAYKLGQLWSRIGKPCIVDLEHDFYLIKFQYAEDYNYVIKEGPWFIARQFLTLMKWEPNFRASEASFTLVAVWVRLLELSVKYFDLEILKKIGKSISVLLRVDGHTLAGHLKPHCPKRDLNAKGLPDHGLIVEESKSLQTVASDEALIALSRRILAEEAGPWQVVPRRKAARKRPTDNHSVLASNQ
ncbi:hypothetical protein REPUB_Repub07fG0143800 [Reevesia pubescens]